MASRDDDLATAFIARDPAAFDRAYAEYGRDLRAVAENVLADRAAAEDCLHDALLRVWGTSDSYRPERGSLRTFLIVCVRNEALSVLRGDRRRSAREERAQRLGPARSRRCRTSSGSRSNGSTTRTARKWKPPPTWGSHSGR
jgi:RNA polymerase sigma-70 factor (ECF subfamily)